jgi:molybdate transport system substrate-binding protein
MAADMKYPQALYEEGVAVTKPVIYAQGGLAYLSSKKQDFTQGISLLSSQKIDKIAIANPKTAPYGKAALEAMRNGGVLKGVEKKLVYAETVSQTVSYAMTAADIGFIAKSSLYSPTMSHFKEGVHWADVDTTLYTPIDQGIVILKEGKEKSEVLAFYDFIQSDEAKKIFRSFGYLVR